MEKFDGRMGLLGRLTNCLFSSSHLNILSDIGPEQERLRVELVDRAVAVAEVLKVLEHLGVECGADDVLVVDVVAVTLRQLGLERVEIERRHGRARPTVHRLGAFQNLNTATRACVR